MGLVCTSAPVDEPITLQEAQIHCRIDSDNTAEDGLLLSYIAAARRLAEAETNRALVSQAWRLDLEAFPAAEMDLPMPPLQSVQSITYLDVDGVRQTLAPADYVAFTTGLVGLVMPAYGKSWPDCRRFRGSVQVDFTAGYGGPGDVPEAIKIWMLRHIAYWYQNRESAMVGKLVTALPYSDAMLDPYRVRSYG